MWKKITCTNCGDKWFANFDLERKKERTITTHEMLCEDCDDMIRIINSKGFLFKIG